MSVFRNLRIYPSHGTRSATLTWEMADGVEAGDVYVAFSDVGTQGTWRTRNASAPVPSSVGMFQDTDLVINSGNIEGFYRLLLTTGGQDFFSEPIQIMGDVTPREYGIVRAIIHQEFTQMRVTNGFPVWYCIPRAHGVLAANIDPLTGKQEGSACGDVTADSAYGLLYKGGFYPPIMTWMRITGITEGVKDEEQELSPSDLSKVSARLMAFPRPARGHMIVDPTHDRRYLVADEIKPYRLRGVVPVAYDVTLEFLQQHDERYRYALPAFDTKAYRRIPYWTPATPAP